MSDFDSSLPVRTVSTEELQVQTKPGTKLNVTTAATGDVIVQVADSGATTINPAKEDGNLATLSGTVSGGRVLTTIQTNAAVNTAQVAGTATSVNTGNADAGTQRVVLASDQPTINVNVTSATDRTNVLSYATSSAVAVAGSSTHSFNQATTYYLTDVYASASGQMKIEIQTGTTGAETTKVVLFTSKGNLQAHWNLPEPLQLTTAQTVKVIRTNMDNQAMDVYSTIQGYQ